MRISFFPNNIIGLDIADGSAEVVEVYGGKIIHKARKEFSTGIVFRGRIKNQNKLREVVSSVLNESAIENFIRKQLVFGLPESQTFIHIFDVEKEEKNLSAIVKQELCNVVPLPCESIAYGFVFQDGINGKSSRVVAVAANREVVEEWEKFLRSIGFTQVIIGVETFSCYVGLGVKTESLPVCVVDIGATSTMVSMYDKDGVVFASSVDRAGDFITKKVEEGTGMSFEEAEKIKCQVGVGVIGIDEKVTSAIKQALDIIILDINESLRYCKERLGVDVRNLIFIGGSSHMTGLIGYFKEKTTLNISLGKYPYLPSKEGLFFGEAAGLAFYNNNGNNFPIIDQGLFAENAEERVIHESVVSPQEEKMEVSYESDEENTKIEKQKKILIVIIIVGVLVATLGSWYRLTQDKIHQEEIASSLKNFSFVSVLPLSFFVSVDVSEQNKDRVKGRIIENKIQMAGEENEAIQTSHLSAIQQLAKGEALWEKPVSILSTTPNKSSIVAGLSIKEYTIKWLVYDKASVNDLFSTRATDEMRKSVSDFAISSIEKKEIKQTDNHNVFVLSGLVSVATDKQVSLPNTTVNVQ